MKRVLSVCFWLVVFLVVLPLVALLLDLGP